MQTKKQRFDQLISNGNVEGRTLFRPILMHFAARYNGHTYGELASDYKVLVESNIKALNDFDLDMVGLISDPYRETQAFGATIAVPVCKANIVKTKDKGGYALGSGNSIPEFIPDDNFFAMTKAALE